MQTDRITDETSLDPEKISALVSAGREVVVQFSKPIYTPAILGHIDSVAARLGDNFQVRFFDHCGSAFDFSVLQRLPSVKNLAVDCLRDGANFEGLHRLENLTALSLGVFNSVPDGILNSANLKSLRKLSVSETRTASLDLRPIAAMGNLQDLSISCHSHGIEAVANLPALERLSLRSMKRVHLSFVGRIGTLRFLHLILGGREDVDELAHPGLSTLEIIRVRGFCRFTPSMFPSLRVLQIEDQIRLMSLQFTEPPPPIERLLLLNCKGLKTLTGLPMLESLRDLRISRTALKFSHLKALGFPSGLRTIGFYTGKASENRAIRAELDASGFPEFSPA